MPETSDLTDLTTALAGRYAIERELARGGMATVYLARDLKHHRSVAVKVLRPELTAALGPDRFAREIAIAARLSHPHILSLYDSGEAAGQLFYVMPYISGESVRQKLEREKQLSIEDALEITRQVAAALGYAHAQGLVHRDVKPENILLHEGEAMVADFGIALADGPGQRQRLTATGFSLGTPAYMSPEQSSGEQTLDARSDVYSLGCVLYELLTGEAPYLGATAQAIIAKRFTDPVPSVRRLRPTVPAAVDSAVTRALARAPADRFTSCADFVAALTTAGPTPSKAPSVAVLPFVNLSPDPANDFLADGITEDVIAQLSKIRSLKVVSRTSVMQFRKREQSLRAIGAALEVSNVLEGSMRFAGDRVRIVAQLVDVETDRHIWGETYDHQLADIFAIQSDVALKLAAALEAELSPEEERRIGREPTRNLRAYQLYLQGRHCFVRFTGEGLGQGIEYFNQAIEADPNYALAWAGVAQAYIELGLGDVADVRTTNEAFQKAHQAIRKALELDGDLGDAHSMLGFLKFAHDFDWAAGERECITALQLSPGSADVHDIYGRLLAALERYGEALAMMERARELDPVAHRMDVASILLRAGRYEEALDSATRGIALDPHYALGRATLGWAYFNCGMPEKGIAELERAVAIAPLNTFFLAQLGQALAMAGNTGRAREILRSLQELSRERFVSPYHMAYVHTGLGEQDEAVACLERAYEERSGLIYGIKGSFLFESLRPHPRFKALLGRLNLTPSTP